jgi:hypothetical protein
LYNSKGGPSPRSILRRCLFCRKCAAASAPSSCRIQWSVLRSELEKGSCCAAVGWQELPKEATNNRICFKICTSFSKILVEGIDLIELKFSINKQIMVLVSSCTCFKHGTQACTGHVAICIHCDWEFRISCHNAKLGVRRRAGKRLQSSANCQSFLVLHSTLHQ